MLNLNTVTWPKIEIFKTQDGGSRHLENRFLVITHRPIVRFQRNFVWGSRTACRRGPHDKIFKIQDGGRPPFWKSLNRYISVKNRPILMKFEIEIFEIQDGGGRHLENRFFGHNSSIDCLISAKFCTRKQNGMPTKAKATWQKLQIFKIQDGGRPPFWKLLNRHISVKNRPILIKFSTLQQILNLMRFWLLLF